MNKDNNIDSHIDVCFNDSKEKYLVIPRSILQSMPRGWQKMFVKLFDDLTYKCKDYGITLPTYKVKAVGEDNKEVKDVYATFITNSKTKPTLIDVFQPVKENKK